MELDDDQSPIECPGCGTSVPFVERPVYSWGDQYWCSVPCMEVAGGLRQPYSLGSPSKFGVREVAQLS